jgi:AraC-like DNA-binding protein
MQELFPGFEAQRTRDDVFVGYYQRRRIGLLSITELAGSRNVMLHGDIHHRAAANPRCCLIAQISGGVEISQSGRRATLAAGDVTLVDGTRPVRFAYGDNYRQLAVQLPHRSLTELFGDELPSAEVLSSGSPLTSVLRSFALTLFENAEVLPEARDLHLRDSMISLLGAAARSHDAHFDTRQLSALRRHILSCLDDPELSPESIARHHRISVRTLHRVFAQTDMSVGEWILLERLERCRTDLSNRQMRDVPIGDLAMKWGFNSFSHFSRAFKRRYGVTPREWRLQN